MDSTRCSSMKDRFSGIMLAWLFLSDFKFPKNRLNGQLNVLKIFTLQKQVQETRPEGAKNLGDVFPPSSISVPDPVSVRDLAVALRMKPHFVMAGLMHFNILASLTTSDSPQ